MCAVGLPLSRGCAFLDHDLRNVSTNLWRDRLDAPPPLDHSQPRGPVDAHVDGGEGQRLHTTAAKIPQSSATVIGAEQRRLLCATLTRPRPEALIALSRSGLNRRYIYSMLLRDREDSLKL